MKRRIHNGKYPEICEICRLFFKYSDSISPRLSIEYQWNKEKVSGFLCLFQMYHKDRLFVALLGLDLLDVEFELFAFKNISIGATALSGSGGNGGQNTTGSKLIFKSLFNLKHKRRKLFNCEMNTAQSKPS